jgi:hypothetical protein
VHISARYFNGLKLPILIFQYNLRDELGSGNGFFVMKIFPSDLEIDRSTDKLLLGKFFPLSIIEFIARFVVGIRLVNGKVLR